MDLSKYFTKEDLEYLENPDLLHHAIASDSDTNDGVFQFAVVEKDDDPEVVKALNFPKGYGANSIKLTLTFDFADHEGGKTYSWAELDRQQVIELAVFLAKAAGVMSVSHDKGD